MITEDERTVLSIIHKVGGEYRNETLLYAAVQQNGVPYERTVTAIKGCFEKNLIEIKESKTGYMDKTIPLTNLGIMELNS